MIIYISQLFNSGILSGSLRCFIRIHSRRRHSKASSTLATIVVKCGRGFSVLCLRR